MLKIYLADLRECGYQLPFPDKITHIAISSRSSEKKSFGQG